MKQLTQEQIDLIKKPLPKEAIKPHPTKNFLSTIKAIYVTERLNDVFGIGAWRLKTDIIPFGNNDPVRITINSRNKEDFMVMSKTIFEVPEYGIYYECIAGSSNDDAGDAAKGSATDAITKICSYIGIGADVFKGISNDAPKNQFKPSNTPPKQSSPAKPTTPPPAQQSAAKVSNGSAVTNEQVTALRGIVTKMKPSPEKQQLIDAVKDGKIDSEHAADIIAQRSRLNDADFLAHIKSLLNALGK